MLKHPYMKALILAGGFAKRLWPLTLDKAKPLLPLAGRPVISHIVEKIPRNIPIVVSTNQMFAEDFCAWRDLHPERDVTIFVEPSASEQNKKGALAAVGLALRTFGTDQDWLVVGGDNFFTFSIEEFIAENQGIPTLAGFDIQDLQLAKRLGVVVNDGRKILDFQEKPQTPRSTLVVTACFYLPQTFHSFVLEAADLLPDTLGGVFGYFLSKGIEVHVHSVSGYWNDIGSFDAYLDAHAHAGADLAIPAMLTDPVLENVFEGVNHVDPSCTIRHSRIRNCIVLAHSIVENSQMDSCIVDRATRVVNEQHLQEIVRAA